MSRIQRNPKLPKAQPLDALCDLKPMKTWHRPSITFVEISATAVEVGSETDGFDGSIDQVG